MISLRTSSKCTGARRQGGAYAVEYALIFPVFFAVFYGVFAYGTVYALRLGLQHAAEEGARAALRYPVAVAPGDNQVTLRESQARSVADAAANWIAGLGPLSVDANICPTGLDCLPAPDARTDDAIECGSSLVPDGDDAVLCQVVVTVTYPYDEHPVFPSIPGFGMVMPENLQGRARVLIDGRALQL